jgi:hypothetical protein
MKILHVLALALLLSTAFAPTAHASLVAYWRFDEANGTTAYDLSGNGNDGVIVGGAVYSSDVPPPGPFPGHEWSLQLDGVDDGVIIPDSPTLQPTSGITIEAWIKPAPGAWVVLGKQYSNGNANSFQIELRSGGPLNFILSDTSQNQHMCTGPTLPSNVWQHIAASWDGATMRLYVDAQEVASVAYAGDVGYDAHPMLIGGDDDGTGSLGCCLFSGLMDEVQIWDEAIIPTPVRDRRAAATAHIEQVYPNPFNPMTTIAYVLANATEVRIDVIDVSGARVRTLVDARFGSGRHETRWDGRDGNGRPVASGVYVVRLTTARDTSERKVVLLK